MPSSTELSSLPMERLKAFVQNGGVLAWDDAGQIEPIIANLCASQEHEADLLMRAVRNGVPTALARAFERGADRPSDDNISLVYKHLCKRLSLEPAESEWAVRTIAVAIGYIPVPPEGDFGPATPIRPAATQGYSYQPEQPTPGFSSGERLTEIEKRERASAQAQADYIELPGATDEPAGQYSGPINTTLPSERSALERPYPGPINTTLPASAAPRSYRGPINTTLPADARAAAQRNDPYAQNRAGQNGGIAIGGSWPPSPSAPAYQPAPSWSESSIPEEVDDDKWCWSGFLGGIWWMWAHGMKLGVPLWLGLIVVGDLPGFWWLRPAFSVCLCIFLGLKGNALAWQYRSFASKDEFRKVQRAWVIFGIFWNLILVVWFCWPIWLILIALRMTGAGHM